MTFTEAYAKMLLGNKIKRPSFKGYWFINQETGQFMIHLDDGKEIKYGQLGITVSNCAANDWEIVSE